MYDIVPTVDKGDRQIGKTEVADRPSLLLKSGAFEDALKDAKIVSGLFIFMILIAGSIYVIRFDLFIYCSAENSETGICN